MNTFMYSVWSEKNLQRHFIWFSINLNDSQVQKGYLTIKQYLNPVTYFWHWLNRDQNQDIIKSMVGGWWNLYVPTLCFHKPYTWNCAEILHTRRRCATSLMKIFGEFFLFFPHLGYFHQIFKKWYFFTQILKIIQFQILPPNHDNLCVFKISCLLIYCIPH